MRAVSMQKLMFGALKKSCASTWNVNLIGFTYEYTTVTYDIILGKGKSMKKSSMKQHCAKYHSIM
jgi:hypothetical protein